MEIGAREIERWWLAMSGSKLDLIKTAPPDWPGLFSYLRLPLSTLSDIYRVFGHHGIYTAVLLVGDFS
jgi:hypothetical protein